MNGSRLHYFLIYFSRPIHWVGESPKRDLSPCSSRHKKSRSLEDVQIQALLLDRSDVVELKEDVKDRGKEKKYSQSSSSSDISNILRSLS